MDFSLTVEQKTIQEMAQDFVAHELRPFSEEWDRTAYFTREALKAAAALGFGSLYIAEKYGGCGLSREDGFLVFEALAQGCVSTPAFLSIHNMTSWILDQYGSEAQCHKWLRPMISMEKFSSYCLTEPHAGSDAASLRSRAIKSGDFYVLNGEKCFISGGGQSDYYFCIVRTSDHRIKGLSCFLVEKGTPGLSFGPPARKMGWRNQPTTTVSFSNCKVPIDNLIGKEGEGFNIAMEALNGGRLNIAACALGGARESLRLAKKYMEEREQFGKKLTQFQVLQFRYVDAVTQLEAARLLGIKAAYAMDQKEHNLRAACAMAKRFATDTAFQVSNEALQFLGGYGYLQEYHIERIVRALRVMQILEGTNEVMRIVMARDML